MGISLQVGKKYRNRSGGVIEIISEDPDSWFPFKDRNGRSYSSGGGTDHYGYSSAADLIEEIGKFKEGDKIRYYSLKNVGNDFVIEHILTNSEGKKFYYCYNCKNMVYELLLASSVEFSYVKVG